MGWFGLWGGVGGLRLSLNSGGVKVVDDVLVDALGVVEGG